MENEPFVRPMLKSDISECAKFVVATPLWERYGVTLAGITARLETAFDAGGKLFVAEAAGKVTGFVWCVERGVFARSGYIPLIGVRPGGTGHGVGAMLLSVAEQFLGESSSDVFLTVSDFNTGAQRFYQRNGYTQVGALPDYVIAGITELIYRKQLELHP